MICLILKFCFQILQVPVQHKPMQGCEIARFLKICCKWLNLELKINKTFTTPALTQAVQSKQTIIYMPEYTLVYKLDNLLSTKVW